VTERGDSDLDWLAARLGWRCRDAALVATALTHRSAGGAHNERLEFLGDAVLSFVVAERLCQQFPAATEGELSRYRASLVSGESLADIAEHLGLGERLRLGPGELRSGGFRRRSTLGDAFEALLGAIYLDGGLAAIRQVLEPLLVPRLARLRDQPVAKDAKTRLQEYLQARALPLPHYTVETITGEPHEQTFTVRCAIIRRAEQVAAEGLLALFEAAAGEP
jgi:ribonuclease III